MTPGLTLTAITKRFGPAFALDRVSFNVSSGEIVGLLGPSGSGKSTLLNVIAGIEAPDEGGIAWNGQDLTHVPVHRRGFGLMFQDYALFPHKNVFENVAFGLRLRGRPAGEIRSAVAEALRTVGLPGFEKRNVNALSGGEAQRVALARALVPRPRLLMLDEPLGALDRNLRERLMSELPAILKRLGQTAIYVTHDQEEAFSIADRLVLLNAGRVAQIGRPAEVYASPASEFVARFLGLSNLIQGTVENPDPLRVRTDLGSLLAAAPDGHSPRPGDSVTVLIRPEVGNTAGAAGINRIGGTLRQVSFRGQSTRARVRIDDRQELTFDFSAGASLPEVGQPIQLSLPPERVQVLRWEEGQVSGER